MTLGEVLLERRIESRLSIQDLAAMTSIRIGLLAEMEANNFSHCGGDTYARGHIKNIATKIGADADELIAMYNEEHSIERRAIHEMLVENSVTQVPREKRMPSWKFPLFISLAILGVAAIVQIIVSNSQTEPLKPVATEVATATPSPSSSSAVPQSPITLVIDAARGNSYVDIVVDGEHVLKGSLFQGEKKSFTGNVAVSIYLSNPADLDLTLNGKLLAPLGGANQEVRRTFR